MIGLKNVFCILNFKNWTHINTNYWKTQRILRHNEEGPATNDENAIPLSWRSRLVPFLWYDCEFLRFHTWISSVSEPRQETVLQRGGDTWTDSWRL